MLLSPSTRVLAGQQVGGFFVWLFWWWRYAWTHGLPLFHTDFVMYPDGVPLFPHSPVNEIPAFILQSFLSPYATFNLLLIATNALTAATAYLLFLKLSDDPWAALCGAFAYGYSAYMFIQHFHGQIIEATLYFNPLLALAWLAYLERPSRLKAAALGGALTLVFLSGPYVAFSFGGIFSLAVVLYDLWGEKRLLEERAWVPAALAGAAALAVAAVVYRPLWKYAGQWLGAPSFYRLSLAAYFDPPFWNTAHWIQRVRPLRGAPVRPEEDMAWLGLGSYAAIASAFLRKDLREEKAVRFWLWVGLFAALLSLGPWLEPRPGWQTWIPLPYLAFRFLPLVSSFRNPGRILMTVTLASSALLAIVFARLTEELRPAAKALLAAVFIAVTAWEFGLQRLGERWVSSELPAAYQPILDDGKGKFAILELPSSYDAAGDLLLDEQYYMLLQPRYRRPMVLGFPSRHLPESLSFTQTTPLVYELTHPWVLKQLDEDPALASRRRLLSEQGAAILDRAGIRYVVLHTGAPVYDPDTRARERAWLERALGRPVASDASGTLVFSAAGGSHGA